MNPIEPFAKYPRLLSEEIMLITPAGYDRMMKTFEARLVGQSMAEANEYEIVNGVAVINICGPIGHNLDEWDKYFGAVDVKDIADSLEEAENDRDIKAIALYFDSPGGMVTGTPELADKIMGLTKPTKAITDSVIASAAYWLGCSCDEIVATRSADIGSIGVYIPFFDVSEMLKAYGVKLQLFTSGKYKGMGFPGSTLSKDQAKLLQTRVMETAEMFWDHVRLMRGDVAQEAMQGQTFRAEAALKEGLIDAIVEDVDEAVEMSSQDS